MPSPFGPMPDFRRGDKPGKLFDADFINAMKAQADRINTPNFGSYGVGGQNLDGYEPSLTKFLIRITGRYWVEDAEGVMAYQFQKIQEQDTSNGSLDEPLWIDDPDMGSDVLPDYPAFNLSDNVDVPIDGSVIVEAWESESGEQVYFNYPGRDEILVEVTNYNRTYGTIAFKEIEHVYPGGNGSFGDRGNGSLGTLTLNTAIEPNGVPVSIGDRGYIRRGYVPGGVRTQIDFIQQGRIKPTPLNCIQNLTILNAGGGNFTLGMNNTYTSDIAFNANAATIEGAINAIIPPLSATNVTGNGTIGDPFNIVFGDNSEWESFDADISNLKNKQQWLFLKPVSNNVTINNLFANNVTAQNVIAIDDLYAIRINGGTSDNGSLFLMAGSHNGGTQGVISLPPTMYLGLRMGFDPVTPPDGTNGDVLVYAQSYNYLATLDATNHTHYYPSIPNLPSEDQGVLVYDFGWKFLGRSTTITVSGAGFSEFLAWDPVNGLGWTTSIPSPYIGYSTLSPANWSGSSPPANLLAALDRIAAALSGLGAPP